MATNVIVPEGSQFGVYQAEQVDSQQVLRHQFGVFNTQAEAQQRLDAQNRADEIVQARRKAGHGDVTVYSAAPVGAQYGADLGQPIVAWREGECIPMRREEAEGREDCEIAEAAIPTVASAPPPLGPVEEEAN